MEERPLEARERSPELSSRALESTYPPQHWRTRAQASLSPNTLQINVAEGRRSPMAISSIVSHAQDCTSPAIQPTLSPPPQVTLSSPSPSQTPLSSSLSPPVKKRRLSLTEQTQADPGMSSDIPDAEIDPPRKRWKTATGHRRNLTIKQMVAIEAPTRPRRSRSAVSPAAAAPAGTSTTHASDSKENLSPPITSVPSRRASLSPASGDSEDDGHAEADTIDYDDEAAGGVRATNPHAIEAKRRANTVAARRSRQRKLEHVRTLETRVLELAQERDELKMKCATLEDRVEFLKTMIVSEKATAKTSTI